MRRVIAGVLLHLGFLLDGASGNPALGPEPAPGFPHEEGFSTVMGWHLPHLARRADAGDPGRDEAKVLGVLAEGIASHYLGPDDKRPINPLTGGRVEPAAEPGYMVDGTAPTAAMKGVALGTKVRVTNVRSGKSVIVRINDRGPYRPRRVIDLTPRAFAAIADSPTQGLIKKVKVERLSDDAVTSWPEIRLTVREWAEIRRRGKKGLPVAPMTPPVTMIAAAPALSIEPTKVSPETPKLAEAPVKVKQAPIAQTAAGPASGPVSLRAFAPPPATVEKASMEDLPAMVAALSANSVKKLVKRALSPLNPARPTPIPELPPANVIEKPSNPVLATANPVKEPAPMTPAPSRVTVAPVTVVAAPVNLPVPAVVPPVKESPGATVLAQVPPPPPAPAKASVAQVAPPPPAAAPAVAHPAPAPTKPAAPPKRVKRTPAKRATAPPVSAPAPAPVKPVVEPPVMLASVAKPAPAKIPKKASTRSASKPSKARRSRSVSRIEHVAATSLPISVLLARAQAALRFD